LRRDPDSGVVLVVLHEPEVGGASRAVLRVIPHLERRGWRFSFWAPGDGGLRRTLEERGYEVAGRPRLLRYHWRNLREPPGPAARLATVPGYLRALSRRIDAVQPALIHVNTLPALPEALTARRSRRPVLLHVHEMLPAGLLGAAAGALARAAADTVVTVSAASARALGRHGVPAAIVPNGIEPPASRREASGREAGATPGPLVVGTLGTVSARKGSDVFVDLARRVLRERDDVEFRMVGPLPAGPEEHWARRLVGAAREAGVVHRVTSDVFGELGGWDVLVLPSRVDPFPLAVLEGMAIGLPVVGSDVDGIAEQLAGGAGVLVPPDDPQALQAAVLALLSEPERRAALGAAARDSVQQRFTLARQAELLHQAYERTVQAAARRA
jgi:glycosyltransferase involved in cell wall biosynthesis